jgi:hypothetical protein
MAIGSWDAEENGRWVRWRMGLIEKSRYNFEKIWSENQGSSGKWHSGRDETLRWGWRKNQKRKKAQHGRRERGGRREATRTIPPPLKATPTAEGEWETSPKKKENSTKREGETPLSFEVGGWSFSPYLLLFNYYLICNFF